MSVESLLRNRYGRDYDVTDSLGYSETVRAILTRGSVREWARTPVNEELLLVLFASAFSASSKSDLQQAAVCLVENEAQRKRIGALVPSMQWMERAPTFMVWLGDGRRIREICQRKGKPFANEHLDSFFNAATDCALAMQTFIIAAEAEGLACCPISAIREHSDILSEILELPNHVFPYAGLCVGYPAEKVPITMRLPLEIFVHKDRYDDSDFSEKIDGYDRRRAEAQAGQEEIAGRSEGYGWSENKAHQQSVRQRAGFGSFVRGQGFNLD